MNSTTIITIAIAVIAVLGLGVVLTATRRSDMSGVGVLSRETRKRDRNAAKTARKARHDVEASAVAVRSSAVPRCLSLKLSRGLRPIQKLLANHDAHF
jgi:FtsZ-interacting cell division protein ZipA